MTRTSPPQVAFSSGEISPLLHRRFDYQRFQTGLRRCHGFLPLAEGGVTRAPGTWFKGRTRNDSPNVRLVPFVFAANDACVLEFTPNRMRVWRYGALVMAGGTPYELTTPYGSADLPDLRWVQSADVLYLADGKRPIQRLARLALDNWTIGAQVFERGPFRLQNLDKARTIQASAMTGSVTLTASTPTFTAAHVGSLMRLTPSDLSNLPQWQPDEDLQLNPLNLWGWSPGPGSSWTTVPTRDVYRRYDGRVYRLTHGNNSGINPPIHDDGEALTDNVTATKWLYVCDDTGIVRITAVASATSATATVLRPLSPAVYWLPTWRWSEGAWSDIHGYPSAIELYDQRLVAAATPAEPRTVWFSTAGDFADFLDGTDPDEAFAYTLSGNGTINRIINIFAGRTGVHIFALGEEFSTRAESRDRVIGPTNAVFSRDSAIGSAPARPIAPHGDPIFISRDRRAVHAIAYSLEADANRSQNLIRPARHLGDESLQEIVWQGAPLNTAWISTGLGHLRAMIYDPSEEVLGWASHSLAGGSVKSMAVTPSADGRQDIVTLAVSRGLQNGASIITAIEEMALPAALPELGLKASDACHLSCATSVSSVLGADSFTVAHLAGEAETVAAWTSGGSFQGLSVALDGTITLPVPVTWAVIGLFDPSHVIETLDITAQANDGATMGRRKRLQEQAGIGLHATAALQVQAIERDFNQPARPVGTPRELVARPVASTPVLEDTLVSGVAPLGPPTGQAGDLAYRFTPVGAAPATLTAVVPFVQEAGR